MRGGRLLLFKYSLECSILQIAVACLVIRTFKHSVSRGTKGHHGPSLVVCVRNPGPVMSWVTQGSGLTEATPGLEMMGSELVALLESLAPRPCRDVEVFPKTPSLQFPSPPCVFPDRPSTRQVVCQLGSGF